jgi:hypothetical protein
MGFDRTSGPRNRPEPVSLSFECYNLTIPVTAPQWTDMSSLRFAALMLTMVSALSACALVESLQKAETPPAPAPAPQFEIRPAEPEPAQAAGPAAGAPLLPRAKPPPPRRPESAAVRPNEMPASPQPPAVATPLPAPAPAPKVIGLSQPETLALLGPPSGESAAGPAKVWEYQAPGCRLEVEFFLDVSRNAFYALNYSAAGADGSPQQSERCLQDVLDDRARPR